MYFRTLAQLDAAPYVGPIALGKLRDYVRAAGLVDDRMSDRWHVQSQTAPSVQRSNDWDSTPAFAIDRNRALVALYQTDVHAIVLSIDGQTVNVPTDPRSFAYQKLHVAVDETNAIHVFYGAWLPGNAFKHLIYRAGQWADAGELMADSFTLASNASGAIFGLARAQKWSGSTRVDVAELHHFASTAVKSSVESLPAATPIFATDPAALGVGLDGVPVITWLHGACGYRSCGGVESVQLLRRTPSGFASATLAGDPAWIYSRGGIWTGGGPIATVVITQPSNSSVHASSLTVLQESAGTFVARSAVDEQGLPVGVGTIESVAVDAQGALHACATPQSTSWLNALEVSAAGVGVGTAILNGDETRFCAMVTDAAQHVNLIYGNRDVYLHATRE